MFDAPVVAGDRRAFAGVTSRARSELRTDHDVEVAFGVHADQFVVVVRDAFGTLGRGALLRHLDKGLHASDKVEHKIGGAGLGLFLVTNAASRVSITVTPGTSTEIACAFRIGRIAPALQLDFVERAPPATRTTTRVRYTRRARRRHLGHAAVVAAAIAITGSVATLALPAPTSMLVITTEPADATVAIEGRLLARDLRGARAWLTAERTYRVRIDRSGYTPRELSIVPAAIASTHVVTLERVATLELDTSPTDAAVAIDGIPAGSTPLRVTSLPPASTVEVAFDKPGYVRASARVTTPRSGEIARYGQPHCRSHVHPGHRRVDGTSEQRTIDVAADPIVVTL